MRFTIDDTFDKIAKMKVVGVGGAGGNAVNRMVESGLEGVEFIAVNTDALDLENNSADIRLQIGDKVTKGLGAGANPNMGMEAMIESREQLKAHLEGSDMVFIAAGMGGGTGTGAAPIVAEVARELDILSVGVVTTPFFFEGPKRKKNAMVGLEALKKVVDTTIVIPNEKLSSVLEKKTSFREAFKYADEVLTSATRGISEIILKHGDIQVDFAYVKVIMKDGGDALMGTGIASGENRAIEAAEKAIYSPLLSDVSVFGASGVLVNITAGEDLGMSEVEEVMNYIHEAVGDENDPNIIFGTVVDPSSQGEITVTVVATGFAKGSENALKVEVPASQEGVEVTGEGRENKAAEQTAVVSQSDIVKTVDESCSSSKLEPVSAQEASVEEPSDIERITAPLAPDPNTFTNAEKGNVSEMDGSTGVDYETPAFLRGISKS